MINEQNKLLTSHDDSRIVLYQPDETISIEVKLDEGYATVRKFRTVRKEGNRLVARKIDHYNLDMIISFGFRVNSKQSHDSWLIIDDRLYHCGHSLNANGGHKMSAKTLMGTSPEVILGEVERGQV